MDVSLATIVLWAVPVVFAITLHEAAHGYVAKLFGDQTAWMLGRVTANPIKHIDPVGTILVPGMLLLLREVRQPGVHLRVGEAGAGEFRQPAQPEAGHVLGRRRRAGRQFRDGDRVGTSAQGRRRPAALLASDGLMEMAGAGIQINLMLMALNLLPILPLDGGRIAVSLLPHSMADGLRADGAVRLHDRHRAARDGRPGLADAADPACRVAIMRCSARRSSAS